MGATWKWHSVHACFHEKLCGCFRAFGQSHGQRSAKYVATYLTHLIQSVRFWRYGGWILYIYIYISLIGKCSCFVFYAGGGRGGGEEDRRGSLVPFKIFEKGITGAPGIACSTQCPVTPFGSIYKPVLALPNVPTAMSCIVHRQTET